LGDIRAVADVADSVDDGTFKSDALCWRGDVDAMTASTTSAAAARCEAEDDRGLDNSSNSVLLDDGDDDDDAAAAAQLAEVVDSSEWLRESCLCGTVVVVPLSVTNSARDERFNAGRGTL
jgi:hypothetical protein